MLVWEGCHKENCIKKTEEACKYLPPLFRQWAIRKGWQDMSTLSPRSDFCSSFTIPQALERAEALKKRANTVLADTRYPEAVEQYTLGIKVRAHSSRATRLRAIALLEADGGGLRS